MKKLGLAALGGVPLLILACGSGGRGEQGNDGFETGPLPGPSCVVPADGCPCDSDGSLVECGDLTAGFDGDRPACSKGYRRCDAGLWTSCEKIDKLTPTGDSVTTKGPAATRGACTNDVCDPNCFTDFGDPTIADGGVTAEVGSGSGTYGKRPNGPPPSDITTKLAAAGIPSGGIYHELDPGDTAVDPLTIAVTLNSVDVYFLMNSTTAMKPTIVNLSSQMASVVAKVKAKIPSVAFGDGRFSNYLAWPYASQQFGNTVYENRVNLNTDETKVVNDFNALKTDATSATPALFVDTPYVQAQASTPAMYSMATGEGLTGWVRFGVPGSFVSDWWNNVFAYYGSSPGASYFGDFVAKAPGCSAGGLGYPCFRPGAFHIVVLLQDAPAMNGPAGSFPYYQMKPRYFPFNAQADYTTENSWYWWQSKTLGAATTNLPTDNGTTATNVATKPIGTAQIYVGNVLAGTSSYKINNSQVVGPGAVVTPVDPAAKMKCQWSSFASAGYNGTGPDATYDFTVASTDAPPFYADVAGSSYDTVLYLINRDTNLVVACADDSLAWLSAEDISGSGVDATIRNIGKTNSTILGNLPAGRYRLVVDNLANSFPSDAAMQNRGSYQLNMWPNIDDPRMSGNPHGKDVSTPSYTQMINAIETPALKTFVMAIESSGYDCGETPTAWEKSWTRWSLENMALDTKATVSGTPLVYSIRQNGSTGTASGGSTANCPGGSTLGDVVANGIATMTNNLTEPVSLSVIDEDDATDFDGTTGSTAGPTVYTPTNIDDATFVSSVVALPATGCVVASTGSSYSSCLPGATPNFSVNFAVPATVTKRNVPQIFYFKVKTLGIGGAVLQTTPVTIVIPPFAYPAIDYERDFDGTSACSAGYKPSWGFYRYTSSDPSDSKISFYVKSAATSAALTAATEYGPYVVAKVLPAPDTHIGAIDLGSYLATHGAGANAPFVRVRAHLDPSTDGLSTSTLSTWSLELKCVPNE